jgi:uncharacterized protein YndB with AHSA1/START domain
MTVHQSRTLLPLRKAITVPWSPEAAFRRFTSEIARWWPLRTHSVGKERAETVVFGSAVGERIVERIRGGGESTWGTITAWQPPHRVAFTWHPGRSPDTAQEVELRFVPDGAGTRLELTHAGWERLGALAAKARRGYPIGWAYVLRLWAGRRRGPFVWGLEMLIWLLRPLTRRAARRHQATGGS